MGGGKTYSVEVYPVHSPQELVGCVVPKNSTISPILESQTISEISFETGETEPNRGGKIRETLQVMDFSVAVDSALESRSHHAGIEPNKSANGNRDSLPPVRIEPPLAECFEAQIVEPPNHNPRMPTLDGPAPDQNHNAEGRDSPKISPEEASVSDGNVVVVAPSRLSAPNFFHRMIDRIYSHTMQARGYHTEHIGTTRVWRK